MGWKKITGKKHDGQKVNINYSVKTIIMWQLLLDNKNRGLNIKTLYDNKYDAIRDFTEQDKNVTKQYQIVAGNNSGDTKLLTNLKIGGCQKGRL